MTTLLARRNVSLGRFTRSFASQTFVLDGLTTHIVVRLKRPMTASPVSWDASGKCGVAIVVSLDGEEYRVDGRASGGIRLDGVREIPEYVLIYRLPVGRFGVKDGLVTRLGERKQSTFSARVELSLVSGSIDTEIEVTSTP